MLKKKTNSILIKAREDIKYGKKLHYIYTACKCARTYFKKNSHAVFYIRFSVYINFYDLTRAYPEIMLHFALSNIRANGKLLKE